MKLPQLCSALAVLLLGSAALPAFGQQSFVNWETPHVSPLALSADGTFLFACNTPDNRLEVFDVSGGVPALLYSVQVGLDPVSVRPRTANEVWVVNNVSDSISVVDLSQRSVVATIATADEPCDVIFAGSPERAFVSCSQVNEVLVFDPSDLTLAPTVVVIDAEEPRALAKSVDGSTVYAAVFESGNGSTILGGGLDNQAVLVLNNVVSNPLGPHGGQNPPPNSGNSFVPPINPMLPTAPTVGLIVKKDASGRWMDDNGGDWTDLVTGPQAALSNRPVGWDLPDHDVAMIDTTTLAVTYVDRLMNICMALAVNPANGRVSVIGTDCTNEVRFEPNLTGVFLRVNHAVMNPLNGASAVFDLNPHLDYTTGNLPQATRDLALGDPRGIVWNANGTRAYVAGMGSNNVVVIDQAGARVGTPIEVGEGPTGVALDDASGRLYVLAKFEAAVSVIDVSTATEISRVPFYDPSPQPIKVGRKQLYGTHETSGLGHIACASCHVDARMDRLAWDLGDPAGDMKSDNDQNLGMNLPGLNVGFEDFHPMKGPMTTQTLQDIIGKEPLHWRGDRDALEEFGPAFVGLQGDDAPLTGQAMDEFKGMLASVHFPPNPFRGFDNSLPTNLPLPGHVSAGRFSPAGTPLPAGNAALGLGRYTPPATLDGILACATCHTLPIGSGADVTLSGLQYVPFPPGPFGEAHHALVAVDGSTNVDMKIPQLRSEYKKVGFDLTQTSSLSGFGLLHDGSIPSLTHFLSSPVFEFTSDQDLANMVAFMLAFSGSDLPSGSPGNILFPPGTASLDTHAAVGMQTTLVNINGASQAQINLLFAMLNEANTQRVGLVVKGNINGEARGYALTAGSSFQSDRAAETVTSGFLFVAAAPGSELTWTLVPYGSETRIGIDRDEDGFLDRDELDAGSDPADPGSTPSLGGSYCGPAPPNSSGNAGVISASGSAVASSNDFHLTASDLPANQFGYFLTSMTQGFVANPGGSQGNLCLGGNIGRFNAQVGNSGSGGAFTQSIDLSFMPTNPPQPTLPGQTWNFQCWYRDLGGNSNFTDGLEVLFQ